MCKKGKFFRKRGIALLLLLSLLCQNVVLLGSVETIQAADAKINVTAEQISAKSASSHGVGYITDGDTSTYWQSMPQSGEGSNADYNKMYDHNHYIDITLDGTYQLSEICIFNKVDNTYSNYYVYASVDGTNYSKIVSKTSDSVATAEGDRHTVNAQASYLRLNMAYNSNSYETNLAEIELYGSKLNNTVATPEPITVEDWDESKWKEEWDKFEQDADYAKEKTEKEMSSLVGRVLGDRWKDSFEFEMKNVLADSSAQNDEGADADTNTNVITSKEMDVFEIKDGENGKIVIRGNSGVAMASGFNYYLKNYVNVDYNPLYGSKDVTLKAIKPVGRRVVREAQFNIRYALNFCTYSYTMSFWNWDEYEEFLDWAAMNGINLILDIVGQEEVLRQTFREYGYTDEEIKDYICGPAYFAWFYMQNLYSQGGPMPNSWFEKRTELGRQIHDRMQTYGISPAIQGFSGQVPDTFVEKHPDAVFTPTVGWSGFTRPRILKTYLTASDTGKHNYFPELAQTFYAKQKNVFGNVTHYYATDPFHESGAAATEGLNLTDIYREVQTEMLKSDPDAIWVMQQWQGHLTAAKMQDLDRTHTLPLDLQSDMRQQNGVFENNGSAWVYCMLHNFGGRMGLDGEIPVMASDPIETFQRSKNMVGIGMTPEAMENSPVVYELLFDTNWSKDPIDYQEWLKKYSARRAGGESESLEEAWQILLETAYADKGNLYYQGAGETVINARPTDVFTSAGRWSHSTIPYDKEELDKALPLLIENYEAFRESSAYKYDLADVAEQVLCNGALEYHKLMVQAKNNGNLADFEKYSQAFLDIIDLSDEILSTTDEFMVGTWINAARKMIEGADDWTKDLFEFNARALITTWAGQRPNGSGGLYDYSNRKWAGLTKGFYKERWAIWIRNRTADLKGESRDPADAKAESNWFLWEWRWVNRKSDDDNGAYAYTKEPSNADLSELAKTVYEKYSYTNFKKNTDGSEQELVNIAKDKPVTASSAQESAANLTDGNTASEWIAQGAGSHTMEVDLEGAYDITRITLSIRQLAASFPYNWKVEYCDADTSEWVFLEENTDRNMGSNVDIDPEEACKASKIRVTMSTSDAQNSPLTVTEITVYGTEAEGVSYENIAPLATAAATLGDGTDAGGDLTKLTDGNVTSLWGASWSNGSNNYPVTAELTLPESLYVDRVELYFETGGRPFTFYAEATDAQGTTAKISPASTESHSVTEDSYRMEVKKEITKIKVSLTGNTGGGSYSGSWPAIAEIKVMGIAPETTEEFPDYTGNQISTGITVSGEGGATDTVLNGNGSDYDSITLNKDNIFDLGKTYYLSHVNLVFEKGELSLRYQVFAEDEAGGRELIFDKSDTSEILGDATVSVPVYRDVRKIIFVHMGNSGAGSAYAAASRLYGFEAYGAEKSSVSLSSVSGVTNGMAVSKNTPVEITMERAFDVNLVKVAKAANESKKLRYVVRYYDEEAAQWKLFADLTEGNETSFGVSLAVAEGTVFAKKLRLEFAEDMNLADLGVYTTDYLGILKGRVASARTVLAGVTYGDRHGNYKESAKDALEAVLAEADAVTQVSSEDIDGWLLTIENAVKTFQRTGAVYIHREELPVIMADAILLKEKYPSADEDGSLTAIYNAAREAYETYDMAQSALDGVITELSGNIYTLASELEKAEHPEVSANRTELQEYLTQVEGEDKNQEDYDSEAWKEYEEALTAASGVIGNWNVAAAVVAAAKERLEAAMKNLTIQVKEITVQAANGKTELEVGESVQLTAAIDPQNAADLSVTWSSQTAGIADVTAQGVVTAKAVGTAVIRAAANDKSGVYGEIELKVKASSKGGEIKKELPQVGYEHLTDTLKYRVTASDETAKTVTVFAPVNKNAKSLSIPDSVEIDGNAYLVTKIEANAFAKMNKLKSVTIGANISEIGAKAFFKCKKLKTVTVKSSVLTKLGKKAFSNIQKKAKIFVPKKKLKKYKPLLSKAKTAKTVTIKGKK